MNSLLWSRGAYATVAPPVCPVAPFNPATLNLSLWLEGHDCPGAGINWASRASAGTSGSIVTDFVSGGGPQALTKPLGVAPCGLETAQFRVSPYSVLKINQAPGQYILPGTTGTAVAAFKFHTGRDFGFGPEYVSAILHEYNDHWRMAMTPAGAARVTAYTASGMQTATTANTVSSGDWCIVECQWDSTECRVRLNRGAWASFASVRFPLASGTVYLGVDANFGAQVDADIGLTIVANSVLSAGDLTNLQDYCEWYIGTTV